MEELRTSQQKTQFDGWRELRESRAAAFFALPFVPPWSTPSPYSSVTSKHRVMPLYYSCVVDAGAVVNESGDRDSVSRWGKVARALVERIEPRTRKSYEHEGYAAKQASFVYLYQRCGVSWPDVLRVAPLFSCPFVPRC